MKYKNTYLLIKAEDFLGKVFTQSTESPWFSLQNHIKQGIVLQVSDLRALGGRGGRPEAHGH